MRPLGVGRNKHLRHHHARSKVSRLPQVHQGSVSNERTTFRVIIPEARYEFIFIPSDPVGMSYRELQVLIAPPTVAVCYPA